MRLTLSLAALVLAALAAGCASTPPAPEAPAAPAADAAAAAPSASATLEPRSGSSASGTVDFTPDGAGKTRVTIKLAGLTPGPHGLHLHETGDCSAPDAASAGPHWNPGSMEHGAPTAPAHHAGDLGNVVADAGGKVELTLESTDLALTGPLSVVGHSVVVHEKADDLTSQPAGASGARIGCGVVAEKK